MVRGENYTEVVLGTNETRTWTVSSDETLSNLLIDLSASGAEPMIEASGSNWVIENVGFIGANDVHKDDRNNGIWALVHPQGDGTIRRCYFGDGCRGVSEANKSAIGVPAAHSGHIDIVDTYIAYWADNAVYSAHTAEDGLGTVTFDNCYFRNNQVASCRIASDGTLVKRTTIRGEEPPDVPLNTGGQDVKAIYTGYGDGHQRVTIDNCQVDVRDTNLQDSASAFNSPPNDWDTETDAEIYVQNTEYLGDVVGNVTLGDGNGSNPDVTPKPQPFYGPEIAAADSNQRVVRLVNSGSSSVDYWFDVDATPSEVGYRGGGSDNTVDFSRGEARLWGTVAAGDQTELYVPAGAWALRSNADPDFSSVHVAIDEYEPDLGSLGSLDPTASVASFYMNGGQTSVTAEPDETIDFDASTSWPTDGSITSYEWDFGDGTTASGQTTSHSYSSEGTYDATLTVDSEDSQVHSIEVSGSGSGPTLRSHRLSSSAYPIENNAYPASLSQ